MIKRLRTIVAIGGILFSGLAQAALVGNDIIDRSTFDGGIHTFVDTNAVFSSSGVIDEWTIYSKRAGDIYLQAFRSTGQNGVYQLVGQNFFSGISTGVESFNVGVADQISVIAGDVIGWSYTADSARIPFTYGGNTVRWTGSGTIVTGIGAIRTFPTSGLRTYSINANLTTSAVPVPAAVWLFGSGLIGLIGIGMRKKL